MNLTSPSQVKAWCIENGFHPNKVLGQNFLIDQNALKAIVDAGLEKVKVEGEGEGEGEGPCRVLEIGPGLGVLTEEMLKRGCMVTAVEKDPVLAERLVQEAKTKVEGEQWWKNLKVIAGDALEVIGQRSKVKGQTEEGGQRSKVKGQTEEFDHLCLTSDLGPLTSSLTSSLTSFSCMVSNLPYQAGTRILLDLVKSRSIPSMTVLVQTEVAERLAAGPGSKTRGLAGVWAQLDYDVRIVRKVSASCFWPRPEIGSSVVRLDRHDRNASLAEEERRLFHRLTKQAFEHRRKQLGSIFKDMIQSSARAEELSNEEWIEIVKGLIA